MKIKELIAELQACKPEAEIRWYHLENHILTGMELETIIKDDYQQHSTVEITIKSEGSDEGGNYEQDYDDGGHWKPSPFN